VSPRSYGAVTAAVWGAEPLVVTRRVWPRRSGASTPVCAVRAVRSACRGFCPASVR